MLKEEFYSVLENPDEMNDETLGNLRELTDAHPEFPAAWFLYLKNLKKNDDVDFEKALAKAAVCLPDRKQLHHFLNPEYAFTENYCNRSDFRSPGYELGAEENIPEGNSLIDKFLSANPGPIRMENREDAVSFSDTENGNFDDSSDVNDEIITETLAMLFFEQKKYNKALEAFRKLSLKYPEKSVYFASRIEEIEKLKNI